MWIWIFVGLGIIVVLIQENQRIKYAWLQEERAERLDKLVTRELERETRRINRDWEIAEKYDLIERIEMANLSGKFHRKPNRG